MGMGLMASATLRVLRREVDMRVRDTVLVVTNRHDEHASRVIKLLNERAIPVFRLNTEDFPREVTVESHGDKWEIGYHGRLLAQNRVRSCWYRRPLDAVVHDEIRDQVVRDFVRDECHTALEGLLRCLEDVTWVSHPDALRAAGNKLFQLHLARRLGFSVPRTLVTNAPSAFRTFWAHPGSRTIVKLLGRGPSAFPLQVALYTTLVEEPMLSAADTETVRYSAHLFQQYVEKAFEVRVTAFGKRLFAVRIDSQSSCRTSIDWRHYDFANTPHSPMLLPPDIESRIRRMLAELRLEFGAFDFIVTPTGDWVFLEVNPNGQWLWLQDLTGLPMAEALVSLLCREQAPTTSQYPPQEEP